jgi:uncharacterized protein
MGELMVRSIFFVSILLALAVEVSTGTPRSRRLPPIVDRADVRTEELSLQVGKFSVIGDLIIPGKGDKHPLIIVVPGDGPFTRAQGVGLLKTLGLFDSLLAEGYALFLDDKPGYGASRGAFTEGNLLHERAMLLCRWIERLKTHPAIDATCIGCTGASQAGYVMPLALAETPGIAFMIALSCPAVDSVTQYAYLVEKQLLCDGVPRPRARQVRDAFLRRAKAGTYPEYRKAAEFLAADPDLKELTGDEILTELQFRPVESGSEDFFNPIHILVKTRIPVLALFGEKDTMIDPVQGARAYASALQAAGNPFFQVKTIPNADHILSLAQSGSLKELEEKFRTGKITYPPEYPTLIREWLKKLMSHLRRRAGGRDRRLTSVSASFHASGDDGMAAVESRNTTVSLEQLPAFRHQGVSGQEVG